MGNQPATPSPTNLPVPRDAKLKALLDEAGFVFGEPVDRFTVTVKIPVGWSLRDTSPRYDLVDMDLYDPLGKKVAIIWGTCKGYGDDGYQFQSYEGPLVMLDMTKCKINESGWVVDQEVVYNANVLSYESRCSGYQGYPERQAECDELYNKLKTDAEAAGISFVIPRIILHNNKMRGASDAMMMNMRK